MSAPKRLQMELVAAQRASKQSSTAAFVRARPLESDILTFHYVVEGPKGTPYENGYYHGLLKFPSEYPFKPPAVLMITPNGRFEVNTRLCFSMSDFHPESWCVLLPTPRQPAPLLLINPMPSPPPPLPATPQEPSVVPRHHPHWPAVLYDGHCHHIRVHFHL